MGNSIQVLYALECDHAAPGPATLVSGTLICAWCRVPRIIAGVIEFEWIAKCQTCTYARRAGLSKFNAGVMANGHIRHNPSHVVGIEYLRNPDATKTAEKFIAWQGRITA